MFGKGQESNTVARDRLIWVVTQNMSWSIIVAQNHHHQSYHDQSHGRCHMMIMIVIYLCLLSSWWTGGVKCIYGAVDPTVARTLDLLLLCTMHNALLYALYTMRNALCTTNINFPDYHLQPSKLKCFQCLAVHCAEIYNASQLRIEGFLIWVARKAWELFCRPASNSLYNLTPWHYL